MAGLRVPAIGMSVVLQVKDRLYSATDTRKRPISENMCRGASSSSEAAKGQFKHELALHANTGPLIRRRISLAKPEGCHFHLRNTEGFQDDASPQISTHDQIGGFANVGRAIYISSTPMLNTSTTPYKRLAVRFQCGERFAFMIKRQTGLPDPWVCRYLLTRIRNGSINVACHAVDAFCLFYEWCAIEDINLDQRFESGNLFSDLEIENLSEFLRTSKKAPMVLKRIRVKRVVVGNTHKERLKRIVKFIKWRMSHVLPSVADPGRAGTVRENLGRIKETANELMKSSKQKQRQALSEDEFEFLMAVSRPDDPRNPFCPATRHRNFALILMIAELGIRQGESLVLKSEHVNVAGRLPMIMIEPNPNDPEEYRNDPPLVKTNGRELPMSPLLSAMVDFYIMHCRSKLPGNKRNPFIFLNARNGDAMSLDAVYDIFRVLRKRFPKSLPPDLSAHKLRHSWNTRFRRLGSEYGWPDAFRKVVNNYIMGWSKNSNQDQRYGHTEIAREASRALQALHAQLSKPVQTHDL